jgi:hypothetical protein
MTIAARSGPGRRGAVLREEAPWPFRLGVQPSTLCIMGFVTASVVCALAGPAWLVPLALPALALAAAAYLYLVAPASYLAFTWWVWLLTPAVRRMVDLQLGWSSISPIMLAPYLVSAVGVVALLRNLGELANTHLIALALAVAGVAYAYVIGIGSVGFTAATFGVLTWIVPVLFGFHLAATWRRYALWRDTLRTTFAYGLIVLGAYGLLQFALLPPWDAYWMTHAGMSSIGQPRPFEVRVFSTLNAPGVFAAFAMAALLIGSAGRGSVKTMVAQPVVWLSFLLAQVRSAWLGYGLGLCLILSRLPLNRGARLVLLGGVLVVAVLPLLQVDAVQQVVATRFSSFAAGAADHSLQERMQLYARFFNVAVGNIPGGGIGSTNLATKLSNNGALGALGTIDSGILELLYVFGWPGTLLFGGGIILTLIAAMGSWYHATDRLALAALSVSLALLAQMVFFNTLVGAVGMIFWTMTGMVLASQRRPARATAERAQRYERLRPVRAATADLSA